MGRTDCSEPQCLYSTAIPLLPLWAVRTVQSLSACTVQLYLYSPCGPYGLYRALVPVQYSYTSTPPVGRTDCSEPQCLYKGALYLFLPDITTSAVRKTVVNNRQSRAPNQDSKPIRACTELCRYSTTQPLNRSTTNHALR